jgi:hypothetical protein
MGIPIPLKLDKTCAFFAKSDWVIRRKLNENNYLRRIPFPDYSLYLAGTTAPNGRDRAIAP